MERKRINFKHRFKRCLNLVILNFTLYEGVKIHLCKIKTIGDELVNKPES